MIFFWYEESSSAFLCWSRVVSLGNREGKGEQGQAEKSSREER